MFDLSEFCLEHVKEVGAEQPGPASSLAGAHLMILACSEFDSWLMELCTTSVSPPTLHPMVSKFVGYGYRHKRRGLQTSELAGLLGAFDGDAKQRFSSTLKDNEEMVQRFNDGVERRHSTAHDVKSLNELPTPSDVESFIESARFVAKSFASEWTTAVEDSLAALSL